MLRLPTQSSYSLMNKKRLLAYVVVAAVLAALFYVQFRTWRRFDWDVFLAQTREVTRGWGPIHIFLGIAFTYIAYFMRAVRWRIFLGPARKTTAAALVAPDRKSTRLNSSHSGESRMPSSA